jgi:N-acetylglucosamine-6-phosphate deacetylase
MGSTLITNASVILPDSVLPDHAVFCHDGLIKLVGPSEELAGLRADTVADVRGGYLAPGFIDLHFHGLEHWLVDNGPDDLAAICRTLPKYGVTACLPAVCPRPPHEHAALAASLAAVTTAGAHVCGFHFEGPFLTVTGALPPDALGPADAARAAQLRKAAQPHRAIFSIAPDFPHIGEILPTMTRDGVPAFITHTRANVAQTQAAIRAGARHATHFYDVFPVPEETEPGARPCGAVEAILADPRVSVDFILDGVHVDPAAVQMALQCKGPDRVCLITDSNVGAGLPPGRYRFGTHAEVEFSEAGGPARLTGGSHMPGGLAGSGLTMDRAVRNALVMLAIGIPQAVRMASANPAGVLGIADRRGRIAEDCAADLVLLDRMLEVRQTWVAGQCVYRREQPGQQA